MSEKTPQRKSRRRTCQDAHAVSRNPWRKEIMPAGLAMKELSLLKYVSSSLFIFVDKK
jgi:hypothetical protein